MKFNDMFHFTRKKMSLEFAIKYYFKDKSKVDYYIKELKDLCDGVKLTVKRKPNYGYMRETRYEPEERWIECPHCKEDLMELTQHDIYPSHCPWCGQLLDWSEDEPE